MSARERRGAGERTGAGEPIGARERRGAGERRGARELVVGAVAYHPRVVTIWERFDDWFGGRGVPTDHVLYASYERLVAALLAGHVDVGWLTNTGFVAYERQLGAPPRLLGMRDLDADFASVLVTRRGEGFAHVRELASRRLAVGSRDCGHAAILPLHHLREQGLPPDALGELLRFDVDVGKHGDTGASELRVVQAVAAGEADAGALGDATWQRFRAEGLPLTHALEVAWRSPAYCHCTFAAPPSLDPARAAGWQEALLAMRREDPALREAMDLEGVRRWLPSDPDGYRSLRAALADDA